MIYLNNFDTHASYEEKLNVGGIDFKIPNVSYCKDVKDVHYNPYNLIKFYVGEITEPQIVMIATDLITFENVQVSEGNKWYSYLLPKGKVLCAINGTVNKVVVKADIKTINNTIIPSSTVEASFKGSNTSNLTSTTIMFKDCSGLTSLDISSFDTSNVTDTSSMFQGCEGLTSLDLSKWDTSKVTNMNSMFKSCTSLTSLNLSGWDMSNVTDMSNMFDGCASLTSIRMKGCSKETIDKIKSIKPSSASISTE